LARRLSIISPETKFIFISGHSEDFLRSGGALAGNDIFFAKPFSPKLLLEKIKELLGIEIPVAAVAPGVNAASGTGGDSQHPFPYFTECQDVHMETDRHVD
jgi:DNA-binding response OmpR family regulator